ncbi:TPA: hypothetical protein ACPJ16_002372 [Vibrio alginolyticus]|uniref:hypothetical protein n=1 Tax=Vibrio alginolyticus TaxID=663 RepID=UPI001303778B|nr:hypothetical protein [Vibrio alginolyticus]
MKIGELKMNQTEKFGGNDNTSVMITRIEEDKALVQYVCVATGDEVATMHIWDNGRSELLDFDRAYWNCSINGIPASRNDINEIINSSLSSISLDIDNRQIDFIK